ncbi:MAG: aminopeptidase P family protein [Alphaproteobacteria bacterium]|nr:aminopeptidase P family protein [Alphaproteobacteria bacterium]
MMSLTPDFSININTELELFLNIKGRCFRDDEYQNRWKMVEDTLRKQNLDSLIIYGAERAGTAIPWLTGWPVSAEAALIISLNAEPKLYVQYYNHVPQANNTAFHASVEWAGANTLHTMLARIAHIKAQKIGVIGRMSMPMTKALEETGCSLSSLDSWYQNIRLIKSTSEINCLRLGAYFSDLAVKSIYQNVTPGMREHDLANLAENSWLHLGGQAHIRYFISTNMDNPDGMVPRQNATGRVISKDDLLVMEISGAFRGYAGQVLRSMSMRQNPASWVSEFHDVADNAFSAIASVLRPGCSMSEILDAASIIEENGFTTCDDLIHGFGGGYLAPILGSNSRPAGPIPDIKLAPNMAIVVQPNITDGSGLRGVQTGALFIITDTGAECLQHAPLGMLTAKSA